MYMKALAVSTALAIGVGGEFVADGLRLAHVALTVPAPIEKAVPVVIYAKAEGVEVPNAVRKAFVKVQMAPIEKAENEPTLNAMLRKHVCLRTFKKGC